MWPLVLAALACGAFGGTPIVIGPSGSGTVTGSGTLLERVLDRAGTGARSVGVWMLGYAGGRLLDLLDVGELNVAVGPGAKAGLEYGLGRTTLGQVEAQRIGLDGRQVGTWFERNASYGIFPVSLLFAPFELLKGQGGAWRALAEGGFELGSVGVERTERTNFAATSLLYRQAKMAGPWHERPGDMCALGGEVHPFLVGARTRLKPFEVADFLVGFVGIDLDPYLAHPQGRDASVMGLDPSRTLIPIPRSGSAAP